MQAKAVKKAVWTMPDGQRVDFLLTRPSKGVFRWIYTAAGIRWNEVDYLDEGTAIKAMRVYVETEIHMVGVDLSLFPMEPTPEERAARRIVNECYEEFIPKQNLVTFEVEKVGVIIIEETNLPALIGSFSELLAYVFMNRPRFAKALFPVTKNGDPRDLAMDGLLLNAIEAIEKSTKQDMSNLTKALKEPVSQLITVKGTRK